MQVNITPTKLTKKVKAPASKSWIIRYMIVAAVNGFECTIRNINLCDDVLACMDALDNLGGVMNCGESATVLRLLVPSVIKKYGGGDFVCEGNLASRPLDIYEKIFDISVEGNNVHASGRVLDSYKFDSMISSQFVSGLLIAGSSVDGKCVSAPYVEMTKAVLGQKRPFDVTVPEDETLRALWNIDELKIENTEDNPDLFPLYALKAAVGNGTTVFNDISRLSHKESDRVEGVRKLLSELGADAELDGGSLVVSAKPALAGGCVIDPQNDHRLAMMAAVASQYCMDNVIITDAECVSKSYPNFFDDFQRCGGIIDVIS